MSQERTIYFDTALVSGSHSSPLIRRARILERTYRIYLPELTPRLHVEAGLPLPKTKALENECSVG